MLLKRVYGLKVSDNIEIERVFQFKAFFFISPAISTQVASAPLKLNQLQVNVV